LDNTSELLGNKLPSLKAQDEFTTTEQTYTFKDGNFPTIAYRLAMGTRFLSIDLVAENTSVPNTVARRGIERRMWGAISSFIPSIIDWARGVFKEGTYSQIPIVGILGQDEYRARHSNSKDDGYSTFVLKNNTFADDTVIPNGRYKILLRALKITGDPKEEADYEAWLSPTVVFNAPSA
jgi:hypothetical protein